MSGQAHRDSDRPERNRRARFGPGWIIAAAFVGPGTVTTASVAGAAYGYALLWAILFSVLATIVLQEMASRLGLVSRSGLGEALRSSTSNVALRHIIAAIVVGAIAFGNAAFETGNITGAAMGLESVFGLNPAVGAALIGVAAFAILWLGSYARLERVLVGAVVAMSAAFLVTSTFTGPSVPAMLRGAFVPTVPAGASLTVLALIGTTVVPYNLFLHASIVSQKWPAGEPIGVILRRARWDTVIAVALGGLVTASIVASAAACFTIGTTVSSAASMATQLEPLLGAWAQRMFAVGLFAAGITSAVTAPLAASYAVCGVLGWPVVTTDRRFRCVWAFILVLGTALAIVGRSPVAVIVFAQAANAIVLPIIAVFLLVAVNRSSLLGTHTNRAWANVAGTLVIVVVVALAGTKLVRVLEMTG